MAKNNYNEKWGRDDSKREDVQNRFVINEMNGVEWRSMFFFFFFDNQRYTGNFVNTKNTEGIDPTLTKMLGDWSGRLDCSLQRKKQMNEYLSLGRVGTSLEQQGGVVSMCAGCNRKIDNGSAFIFGGWSLEC